jgi:hypothetical protein
MNLTGKEHIIQISLVIIGIISTILGFYKESYLGGGFGGIPLLILFIGVLNTSRDIVKRIMEYIDPDYNKKKLLMKDIMF